MKQLKLDDFDVIKREIEIADEEEEGVEDENIEDN